MEKLIRILPLLMIFFAGFMSGQAQQVNGTVTDANSGETMPGVNIKVKGTTIGTSTDSDGYYNLNVPSLHDTLVVSFVGYQTRNISINKRRQINIKMIAQAITGQEMIVVGYGSQSTRKLSSSVQNITSKDLPNANVSTLDQMLQGKMSGVRVKQTTGRPGQGLRIRVRGAVSITAGSEPLYVVDGMPINGNISNLSPNQIESISVLKDAAATSLYGSRAANGVVLVQTKQATPGQTKIDINANYGIQHIPKNRRLNMMNAREYAQFSKEVDQLNGRPVNPPFQNPQQYGEGTNWFDVITQPAPIQNYNLTVGGGTEKVNAIAMLNYENQDGVVKGTGYKKLSLRINSQYQPNSKLDIHFNVAPTYNENSNFPTDGSRNYVVGASLLTTPLASPYNSDGSLALTASDPTKTHPNWLRVVKEQKIRDSKIQLLSNASVKYEITDGLFIKTTGNIQIDNSNYHRFDPSDIGRGLNQPPPVIPRGWENNGLAYNWLNENTLTYNKTIGEHEFNILAGFTEQSFHQRETDLFGTNYAGNKIQTISAAGQISSSSDVQKWTLLSGLAKLNYTYKDRYILSASIRTDGSSRFGRKNRWGKFPSVSGAWILSAEKFWNIKPISFFKVRASYGAVGNFDIGNYSYLSTVNPVYSVLGSSAVAGRAIDNLGDSNLGWEKTKSLNIGGDINLFKDRIQITYNYYTRHVSNLLYNVEVPLSSGFSNFQTNIGELRLWGNEVSIKSNNIRHNNLSWNTNFNISFNRNKVLALGTNNQALLEAPGKSGRHITKPGHPIGMFYGLIDDGFYDTQKELENSATHVTSQVGTIKFKDLNGDGDITLDDRTIIGNPWPKFTFGMTNNVSYKNFDLSLTIEGSYGNEIGARHEYTTANLDASYNVLEEVKDRWKSEEDHGAGKYGIALTGSTWLERDWWHTRFLYDGSFISFKNITLGYAIPQNYTGPLGKLRLYVSVQNAFIITTYPGTNPEVDTGNAGTTRGMDDSAYPLPRTFSLGVNISF